MQTDFHAKLRTNDAMLLLLEGKLAENVSKEELTQLFQWMVKRASEGKIAISDRPFYENLKARFESRMNPTQARSELQKIEPVAQKVLSKPEPAPKKEEIVIVVKPSEDPETLKVRVIESSLLPNRRGLRFGEQFVMSWKVVNEGSKEASFSIRSLASNNLSQDFSMNYQLKPAEELIFSKDMQTPIAPGTYTDYFRFITPSGKTFGEEFCCRVTVYKTKYCPTCKNWTCKQIQ